MKAHRPTEDRLLGKHARRILLLAVVSAVFLIVVWMRPDEGKIQTVQPPLAGDFPLEILDENWDAAWDFSPPIKALLGRSMFNIDSVSADRKWVAVHVAGGWPPLFFFDLDERRFRAKLPGYGVTDGGPEMLPEFDPHWTTGSLIAKRSIRRETRYDDLLRRIRGQGGVTHRNDVFFYNLDIARRETQFLCGYEARLLDADFGSGCPNSDRSRIVYGVYTGLRTYRKTRYIIWELRTNKQRTFSSSALNLPRGGHARAWGWLPDDRTFMFIGISPRTWFAIDSLFLVDMAGRMQPRRIPVSAGFDRLRRKGKLLTTSDEPLWARPVKVFNNGRRIRLAAAFRPADSPIKRLPDRLGVWDVDTVHGKLKRVLDLTWGDRRIVHVVSSPSGNSFLAAPTTSTVASGNLIHINPVLFRDGEKPRQLPFEVAIRMSSWPKQLERAVQFLDEDTLIYTGIPYELWEFDLRTNQSELLFEYVARPPQPPPFSATEPTEIKFHGFEVRLGVSPLISMSSTASMSVTVSKPSTHSVSIWDLIFGKGQREPSTGTMTGRN